MSDNQHLIPTFTPVPRAKERSNGWKPHVQRAFIEALADTGSVKAAARLVARSERSAYQLRRHPEGAEFAAAWDAALQHGVARIEDVAMDRALNGVEVPVYSYGKLVGTRRIYNDRLLMFILRNRAPDRFAEGRAKGMSALDKQALAKLKAEWREEWERTQALEDAEADDRALEEFDRKLAGQRARYLAAMSPRTRAAWEAFQRSEAEDKASGYIPFSEDEDLAEEAEDTFTGPPDGWFNEPEEEEPWDGKHRLKDEGWQKPDD